MGVGRNRERRQISKINFIKPRNLSFWTKATHKMAITFYPTFLKIMINKCEQAEMREL